MSQATTDIERPFRLLSDDVVPALSGSRTGPGIARVAKELARTGCIGAKFDNRSTWDLQGEELQR